MNVFGPYWWLANIDSGNGLYWCRQATSHYDYLSQYRPRSMLPYCVTRPQWDKQAQQVGLISEIQFFEIWFHWTEVDNTVRTSGCDDPTQPLALTRPRAILVRWVYWATTWSDRAYFTWHFTRAGRSKPTQVSGLLYMPGLLYTWNHVVLQWQWLNLQLCVVDFHLYTWNQVMIINATKIFKQEKDSTFAVSTVDKPYRSLPSS